MLSTRAWILGETGSETVVEPVSAPVWELVPTSVQEPVSEILGWFCSKQGSTVLPPI